jgi:hypothetical protein
VSASVWEARILARTFGQGRKVTGISDRAQIDLVCVMMINEINLGSARAEISCNLMFLADERHFFALSDHTLIYA